MKLGFLLRCNLSTCRTNKSIRNNTWFESSILSFLTSLRFIYGWNEEMTSVKWCGKQLDMNHYSVVDGINYLRDFTWRLGSRLVHNWRHLRPANGKDGDQFNSCQVVYSQLGLAIHQNDHQAWRRFVEWAQNEIAVVPDFHKRILFSDELHFWLNGYVNKQNCRIWSEANPQVYIETPLHPEKLTVWCDLWAGGILLQK
ncbi:hypothetical protein TNCV_4776211 [Trichonephila clavipes]|nr:hypothetical protein TNCV_4776211 [Trichonephila clavipes]